MTDTNSLRTGAGYALEVGLYATHKAMTEAADTIDTLRAALASAAQLAPPAVVASQGIVEWPVMPPSKGQSPVLFEDGYAEGWAKCLEACKAALAATKTGEQHDNFCT